MSYTEEEEQELRNYLTEDFNIDIYEDLIAGGTYENIVDPLEFLNILYSVFYFFENNINDYLTVTNHVATLKQSLGKQKFYILLLYFFKTIRHYYYSYDDGGLLLPGVGYKIVKYIKSLLEKTKAELYPDDTPVYTEKNQATIIDNSQPAESLPDLPASDASLKQKALLLRYLDQFNLLSLNKIHQDRTKQAALLSFLIGKSYKTTYDAVGEDMTILKKKANLTALATLFEPLKNDFADLYAEILKDLKSAK